MPSSVVIYGNGNGNGERGTGNGERGTGNGERGTGNGERGTGSAQGHVFSSESIILIDGFSLGINVRFWFIVLVNDIFKRLLRYLIFSSCQMV